MNINSLPLQYKPFKEIEIGTNKLIDGEVLFSLNDNVPLLIGMGCIPHVWLSIPADAKGESWQLLVRDNKALHPKVIVKIEDDSVTVNTPDGTVLKVVAESQNLARIAYIDLRPFGIDIHGNDTSLTVMNNNLTGNVFSGAKIMIGIDSEKKMSKKDVEPTS